MAVLHVLDIYIIALLALVKSNECVEKEIDLFNGTKNGTAGSDNFLQLQDPLLPSLSAVHTGKVAELDMTSRLQSQTVLKDIDSSNESRYPIDITGAIIEQCPPWYKPVYDNGSSTTTCECGDSLGGIVFCDSSHDHYESYVLVCFCMTHIEENNSADSVVVGHCLYACYYGFYYRITDLNSVCADFNRTGQLCGRCIEGFAPPVYSFHLYCVECEDHTNNWLKYAAVAFGPLTLFLFIVIIFRISVTSAPMNTFVLVSQVIASPQLTRLVAGFTNGALLTVAQVFLSLFGIWNLDFFRLVYTPFCLNPSVTTIQTIALDYIVAVYPLLLIAVAYTLVVLHDSDFRLVVWLWKPFHACLSWFRRHWNIRTSLIDAFATFLLLSYVKFLFVSLDLLVPTALYKEDGKTLDTLYLYYNGTVELFGSEHRPYAIVAILVLSVFGILPLLLLCLYPCRCFQKCLNCCGLQCFALHVFMDAFQGCYKDGTGNTRDCRYFSAIFMMVRILLAVAYAATLNSYFYVIIAIIFTMLAFSLIAIQPYKNPIYNRVNTFLILTLVMSCTSLVGINVFPSVLSSFLIASIILLITSVLIVVLYQLVVFYWIFLVQQRPLHRTLDQVWNLLDFAIFNRNRNSDDLHPYCTDIVVHPGDHDAQDPVPRMQQKN